MDGKTPYVILPVLASDNAAEARSTKSGSCCEATRGNRSGLRNSSYYFRQVEGLGWALGFSTVTSGMGSDSGGGEPRKAGVVGVGETGA